MAFCEPVTLTGRHASLVPLAKGHLADLAESVQDGTLWSLWYTSIPTPEGMAAEIERRLELQSGGSMLPSAIIEAGSGQAVWDDDLHEYRWGESAARDRLDVVPGTDTAHGRQH
jgi:hypothetical protein